MLIFETAQAMQAWCKQQKKAGQTIGLVPTMGYLHQGHLSLVQEARRQCDRVVVSIFVNPIQFGVGEDLDKYPRDLSGDCQLLEEAQTDAVFAPSARDMYPEAYATFVEMEGTITNRLCGASRPGHFRGVTTVVSKLFNICLPDQAFFGQKDAQQVRVIQRMVRDLNFPVRIVVHPIVREKDGLAMSSRNVYLSAPQRRDATILFKAIRGVEDSFRKGERSALILKQIAASTISSVPSAGIEYVSLVDDFSLEEINHDVEKPALLAVAVRIGKTRLIDNTVLLP